MCRSALKSIGACRILPLLLHVMLRLKLKVNNGWAIFLNPSIYRSFEISTFFSFHYHHLSNKLLGTSCCMSSVLTFQAKFEVRSIFFVQSGCNRGKYGFPQLKTDTKTTTEHKSLNSKLIVGVSLWIGKVQIVYLPHPWSFGDWFSWVLDP